MSDDHDADPADVRPLSWIERMAARRRASRLERGAPETTGPDDIDAPVAIEGPSPIRVLLFGTGAPATGSGVETSEEALGWSIARALVSGTGRGVLLDSLVNEDWTPPDPFRALSEQRLGRYDAVVVISTYRRSLLEVPIDRWLGYVIDVRDAILRDASGSAAVQVLSLPWRRAAEDAPELWGGPLGRHIRTLDTLANASLDDTPRALRLTLSAPADPSEWDGPAFSGATYAAWGAEVAAQLAPRLRLDEGGTADQ